MANNELEFDTPIKNHKEDKFGYSNFARTFANLIYNKSSSQSLVASINAPWGNGKTSCINLMKEELLKHKDAEIIDFNPWFISDSQEDLIVKFFLSLKSCVEKFHKSKDIGKKELKGFMNLLSGFSLDLGIAHYDCNNLMKTFQESKSIDSQKQEIEKFLTKTNKKIIVFIDDIDRLNRKEIIQIFRLVKAVADFKNITYVLAFDKDIVSSILEEEQHIDGNKFLEKIIQLPLDLPIPQAAPLERYFLNKINTFTSGKEFTDDDKGIFSDIYYKVIKPYIKNIRNVNRLYNAILTTYPTIENDVNLTDFIIIEFVRLFYYELWQKISINQNLFTKEIKYEEKDKYKNQMDNILNALKIENKETYKIIIGTLFPNLANIIEYNRYGSTCVSFTDESFINREKQKRICSPDRIKFYFSLAIGDEDISDTEIENILSAKTSVQDIISIFNKYNSQITAAGRTRLSYLLEKLWYYNDEIKKRNLTDVIIKAIFQSMHLFNNEHDKVLDILTTDNDMRFGRLLFRLYDTNTPHENYEILSKITRNPKNIMTVCSRLIVLGQGLGYFTDNKKSKSKYISEEDYLLLIQHFLIVIKEHCSSIKDMDDVRKIVIFVKEFNQDLAKEILTKKLRKNENFVEFLGLFYSTGYSFPRFGYPRKENYGISIKGLEYYFKMQDIKERLNNIIKSTRNTKLKNKAKQLLKDITEAKNKII